MIRSDRYSGEVLKQNNSFGVEYLTFPMLDKLGLVKHLFTTRVGGVSKGYYSTMNLSFTRGDEEERVRENYERLAKCLDIKAEDFVASHQTHTTCIRRVTLADKGKGVTIKRDYSNVDGLITNDKGLALVTYYADCVPLYFVDPKNKAIGLAHSGWRGTANQMGRCMVERMTQEYGSAPEDIYAAIGPSICEACYEVGEDVAQSFEPLAKDGAEAIRAIEESRILTTSDLKAPKLLIKSKEEGKYKLNLWLANLIILYMAGVKLEHISVTDVCTCHNSDYLFSHRKSHDKRGNLAAVLMLK